MSQAPPVDATPNPWLSTAELLGHRLVARCRVLAEHAGEDEGRGPGVRGRPARIPASCRTLDALIFLSPEMCSGGTEFDNPSEYASNSVANGNVFAGIYWDPRFIRAVLDLPGASSPSRT